MTFRTREHVALVGFMGAGKTTIGRRLARELGMAFVDSDHLIVEAQRRTIAEIFAEEGEPAFRAYELEAVRRALSAGPTVVALGGGAVTHAPTRALLTERAVRVYLELQAHSIVARLRRAKHVRPLMGERPTLARVEALLDLRLPLYAASEVTVSADKRTKGQLVREILASLQEYRTGARPST